jgi:hypothetical protein
MPLYFFHVENGEQRLTSGEGEEFSSDESALREAEAIARDLSKNQIRPTTLKVVVTNRDGDEIGMVPLLSSVR